MGFDTNILKFKIYCSQLKAIYWHNACMCVFLIYHKLLESHYYKEYIFYNCYISVINECISLCP